MDHLTGIGGALHEAFNLTGISALVTAILLHRKGKIDQKILLEQLQQKTEADERDDGRDDRKAATEQRKAADERLDTSFTRLEKLLAISDGQRDFFIAELEKARPQLEEKRLRDEALKARGVTLEEAFILVDEALAARRTAARP